MRCPGRVWWSLALALAAPGAPLSGAEPEPPLHVGPAVFHSAAPRPAAAAQPLDVAQAVSRLPSSARHALPPLSARERAWLESRDARAPLRPKRPAARVGVVRSLPTEVGFRGLPGALAAGTSAPWGGGLLERGTDGAWTWTASFSSEGARGLRLQVREAWLPTGSRVDVFGADGEAFGPYAFDAATSPDGFWTNTVFAPLVLLRVRLAAEDAGSLASARLSVAALVHLEASRSVAVGGPVAAGALTPQSQTCFVDASCVQASEFPNIDLASKAVGQLNFVETSGAFVCSGGLLNTTTTSFAPYLLTANHCFSSQSAATSLEVFWDYKTPACGAPEPSPNGFPRTLGSTLLATGAVSDFTLVRLSQDPPDGSVYLGWTTADYSQSGGTLIHRLSHPDGRPQFYSRHQIDASPDFLCSDTPRGNFIYSQDVRGGTGGGSSGSPAYLEDLEVVGQLLGACGANSDDCDAVNNRTVDGAFRVSFPSLQPWLAPASPGPCVPDATTLCLNGARFRVRANWTKGSGESGAGTAVDLTSDSGYFWFFAAANIELVVKVLDACPGFARFWVFAGGLTDVKVRLTVEDTVSGAVRIYDNPLGTPFAAVQDTQAFSCP
jgi:lysyl endopeptidase